MTVFCEKCGSQTSRWMACTTCGPQGRAAAFGREFALVSEAENDASRLASLQLEMIFVLVIALGLVLFLR